jgi:hypothetical protein
MLKHYVSINGPGKDPIQGAQRSRTISEKSYRPQGIKLSRTMNEEEPFFNSMTRYWPRTKRGTMEDAISILKVLESDPIFRLMTPPPAAYAVLQVLSATSLSALALNVDVQL